MNDLVNADDGDRVSFWGLASEAERCDIDIGFRHPAVEGAVVIGAKSFHCYVSNFHLEAKWLIFIEFQKHFIGADQKR